MHINSRDYYFQAHVNAQRGFYFDSISEIFDGAYIATSNLIPDPYWNYVFFSNGSSLRENDIIELEKHFANYERTVSVLLSEDDPVIGEAWFKKYFEEFSGDTWMVASELREGPHLKESNFSIEVITSLEQISAACSVFEDAYLLPSPDGVGYSGLPPAYVEAFRRGLERSTNFRSLHCLGSFEGNPVAIASCYFTGRSAGIYNVAVSRNNRRRGFGKKISGWIFKKAKVIGASDVFLQTEPDSEVQRLYEGLGFSVLMKGILFTKKA